jgi:hypothetical protein
MVIYAAKSTSVADSRFFIVRPSVGLRSCAYLQIYGVFLIIAFRNAVRAAFFSLWPTPTLPNHNCSLLVRDGRWLSMHRAAFHA